MLLEASNSDTSRAMAPTLEPAFPGTGSKAKSEKMKEGGGGGSFPPELPVFHGHHPLSMSWSKVTTGEGLTSKSRLYGPVPSMPGVVRCLPERPEPIYPSSYKNTHSSSSTENNNSHLSPRSHIQKSEYPPTSKPRPLLNRPHHPQLQLPVPGPEVPSSSSSMPPTSRGMSVPASVAAGAGSAFFRAGFPPMSAYGPGGGPAPYMGIPHQRPPPHPGAPAFPGGAVSAAGFMSLAHILFQPKYPMGKKTFQCHECRYITDRKNNLKRHVATMHQDCGKFLECCDTIFRSKAALRDHVLLYHRTGYKCRFCGRNFCRKALLKRHLAVHNGQKEYICEVCDYATSHKSNLERHRKVHGLGSPIGSDDGEHFLPDGPDADGYLRHFRALHSPPDPQLDVSMSDEDRDIIDVETPMNEEEEERRSVMFFNKTDDVARHDTEDEEMEEQDQMKPEVVQNDPLLQAFPINLVMSKKSMAGKKHKNKLYFSDRLRQTHNAEESISDDDAKSTKSNSDVNAYTAAVECENQSKNKPELNQDGEISKEVKFESAKRKKGEEKGEENEDDAPRPIKATSSGEEKGAPLRRHEITEKKPTSMGSSAGCRRLYASPYKCSECGLGLPSQHLLLQHSMICRKGGIEPARPMQALAATSEEEESLKRGRGAGEERRGAALQPPSLLPPITHPIDNQEIIKRSEDKLVNLSFIEQAQSKIHSDMRVNIPLDYKRQFVGDYGGVGVRSLEEIPRDYSVKTLLKLSPEQSSTWVERREERTRTDKKEHESNRERSNSPEEQSCSLPIKKRSLNQYGK